MGMIDYHQVEITIIGEDINLVNNFKIEKVILNCGEFNELEQDLIDVSHL